MSNVEQKPQNLPSPTEILDEYSSEQSAIYLTPGNALGKMAWAAEQYRAEATHDP